jgi:hypothetical protein
MLTQDEFQTLIKLAKKVLWCDRETKRKIQKEGIHIIPARFYSEIPTVEEVENSFEYRDAEGVFNSQKIFNKDRISEFLQKIKVYASEFDPPLHGDVDNPTSFFWKNPAFSFCDAMAYYCIIRHFKPKQILEVGSGYSTLVAKEAIRRNGSGSLMLIEPYPKDFLKNLDEVTTIVTDFIQNISVSKLIEWLNQSDIFFIDSTHTVKTGSDCLYLYLKVIPEIQKQIIIHTHDVQLPFPYPENKIIEQNITWTEQYLLYAYMLDNPKVQVLQSSVYLHNFLLKEAKEFMGNKYGTGGGSIWYELKPNRH